MLPFLFWRVSIGRRRSPPSGATEVSRPRAHKIYEGSETCGLGLSARRGESQVSDHPRGHPGLTQSSPGSRELRAARLTCQNGRGNGQSTSPEFCSPRLQVNRGTCRPHPPPRASRVSHHPPQVSGLTLAHPMLTYPHPPSPIAVRSTNRLRLRGSISGPWSARPKWAPTAVSFLVANISGTQAMQANTPTVVGLSELSRA